MLHGTRNDYDPRRPDLLGVICTFDKKILLSGADRLAVAVLAWQARKVAVMDQDRKAETDERCFQVPEGSELQMMGMVDT